MPIACAIFSILLIFETVGRWPESRVIRGRVTWIYDGDTIRVEKNWISDSVIVRLSDIDCPEKGQPFGSEATEFVKKMILDKQVRVDVIAASKRKDTDLHGRTVGRVWLGNRNISAELIKRGLAFVYPQYLHDQSLVPMEKSAKDAKIGAWSQEHITMPWDWRHRGEMIKRDRARWE